QKFKRSKDLGSGEIIAKSTKKLTIRGRAINSSKLGSDFSKENKLTLKEVTRTLLSEVLTAENNTSNWNVTFVFFFFPIYRHIHSYVCMHVYEDFTIPLLRN
ncbi:hypothetical protein V8G54_035792, partial [Vigna mungo]